MEILCTQTVRSRHTYAQAVKPTSSRRPASQEPARRSTRGDIVWVGWGGRPDTPRDRRAALRPPNSIVTACDGHDGTAGCGAFSGVSSKRYQNALTSATLPDAGTGKAKIIIFRIENYSSPCAFIKLY